MAIRRNAAGSGRFVDWDEAISSIPDDSRVFIQTGCGVPLALAAALEERASLFDNLELVLGYMVGTQPIACMEDGPFSFTFLHPMRSCEPYLAAGLGRYVPTRYFDYATIFRSGAPLDLDVALVHVSAASADGRCSLGIGGGGSVTAVRSARFVIAQMNEAMPYTFGDNELNLEEIDLIVRQDAPLVELKTVPADPVSQQIAVNAATIIEDGATLQFGVGGFATAFADELASKRDLGLHGGLFSETCMQMVQEGVLTNKAKAQDIGISITAEAMGTEKLYKWLDRNPSIRFDGPESTHAWSRLRRCKNLVTINSALEVALDGSVNAEMAGGRIISGPGGQPDFVAGALVAEGGRSIIALPSTNRARSTSRIVARLAEGAPITVPRYLADTVITEHGIAELRWVDLEARATALRAIADPQLRDQLLDC